MKNTSTLAALAALVTACTSPTSSVVLPETRVRVTDEAGKPIGGIRVLYGAESEIYPLPMLGLFPHIDGLIGTRFVVRQALTTQENGEAAIPRRVLELGRSEYFHYEHVYVNLAVDPASLVTRGTRRTLEERCRELDRLCPTDGKVDAIDIAASVWLSSKERADALQPADRRFGVVQVLLASPERKEGLEDDEADPDPVFHSRVVTSRRLGPEVILVPLPGR
jgi:hypothetical protein